MPGIYSSDVHRQFAEYFGNPALRPFLYLCAKKLSEGNICLDTSSILQEEIPEDYKPIRIQALLDATLVAQNDSQYLPFVLHQNRLYLQRYFQYESNILNAILFLIASSRDSVLNRQEQLMAQMPLLHQLFPVATGSDPDWQFAAAITAFLSDFAIITGGPGTGKTTTVAKILAMLYHQNPELKVALTAPTGKAAARMAESLANVQLPVDASIIAAFKSLQPATIHGLLGSRWGTPHFRHTASHPLPYDIIVVDESSMIDAALLAKLLAAVGAGTRILLLGDKDQLASVEAGSLFGDLCKALPVLNTFRPERIALLNALQNQHKSYPSTVGIEEDHPLFQQVVELKVSHRFKADSAIGNFSKAILNNDIPVLSGMLEGTLVKDPEVILDTDFTLSLFEDFIAGFSAFILEPDVALALEKLSQLKVLCAVRQGQHGLYEVNKAIEQYLSKNGLLKPNGMLYHNMPIIITKNNRELGLYNGDTGIVRQHEQGQLMAYFPKVDGSTKAVAAGYISDFEPAFALTIHKSQGSEFDRVMVILGDVIVPILNRELVYTAITRAKGQVLIRSTAEVLLHAASLQVSRASGLIQRLASA